jgi:hypothetical protein
VDVHAHYDGRVAGTDDSSLARGFDRGDGQLRRLCAGNTGSSQLARGLMEGVEDIPGPALAAGLPWGWQSFAEYLDVLDKMPRTLDVGGLITHGAVRAFVMGERGAKNEPATEQDIAQMAALVKEAVWLVPWDSRPHALSCYANDGSQCLAPLRKKRVARIAQARLHRARHLEMVPAASWRIPRSAG